MSDDEFAELEEYAEAVDRGWIPELDIPIDEIRTRREQAIIAAADARHRKTQLVRDFVDYGVTSKSHRVSDSASALWLYLLRATDRFGVVRGKTIGDIRRATGKSPNTIQKYLRELEGRWLETETGEGQDPSVYTLVSPDD